MEARRKIVLGALAGLTCAAVGALVYGVAGRSSRLFGRSVFRGAGRRRSVALTFDDGPSEGTLALLDYLADEGIRATFFQCGTNVERHPDIARRVHAAGHEIGNHTYSHARLCPRLSRKPNLLSPKEIFDELAATQRILDHVTGVKPSLFRAPYGFRWFSLGPAQEQLGLLGVMWTVIGFDWAWTAPRIASRILKKANPGGIVCLHDGRDIQPNPDISAMLDALRMIIPALRAQGYSFETVSELLRPDVP